MNKSLIVTKATGIVNKAGFKVKKYSPEILITVGIFGVVTSAVMACKATTKASDILEETKTQLDMIHDCKADQGLIESGRYSEADARKDLVTVYTQTGLKMAKLYAPSVILGALSITSILASNNILRKRNVAIGAAYAALDRSFKDYRKSVVDRFGETVDRELKYGIKAQKVDEVVKDEETGKEKKVKKTIDVVDAENINSPHARFFDVGCRNWEKDPESNLYFLRAEQNYANDRLKARGYLFLNEVYERLGISTTKAGQIVGWVYDPDNPDHQGDNYVDFGIFRVNRQKTKDFLDGYERTILLDFNVDGVIWDKIETCQR